MPKKKADTEQQAETALTEDVKDAVEATGDEAKAVAEDAGDEAGSMVATAGDVVEVAGDKANDVAVAAKADVEEVIAPVGETIEDVAFASGDEAGSPVASAADDGSIEDQPALAENEVLPTTISKGASSAKGKELPEYLSRRRTEIGRVVSNKMQKTVVVSVERSKPHPLYRKVVRQTVKFMAHDEMNSGMGDTVRIIESRPMSRHKRWQVVEIVQKAEQI